MSGFQGGLFGCFSDIPLCALSCFVPCYSVGKVAESVGENCLLCGVLAVSPVSICARTMIRGKVREKYGIEGSLVGDLCTHWCCGCCSIIQEASEITQRGDAPPGTIIMSRNWNSCLLIVHLGHFIFRNCSVIHFWRNEHEDYIVLYGDVFFEYSLLDPSLAPLSGPIIIYHCIATPFFYKQYVYPNWDRGTLIGTPIVLEKLKKIIIGGVSS